MQQNGELSVEEILESIKKVIARDNKETAQVERYRRETAGVVLRGPGATMGLTPMAATGNDDDLGEELGEEDGPKSDEVLDLSEVLGEEDIEEPTAEAGEALQGSDEPTASDAAMELIEPLPGEAASQAPVDDDAQPEPVELPDAPLNIQTPVEKVAAPMVRHSLEALTTMSETPADTGTNTQAGETPLERMVRESLQPILRDWLDANLEPMVERMVKAELERVMGKLT